MKEALRVINTTLGVKRSSILLFDKEGVMRFTAWVGLSDKYRKAVEGHSPWSKDTKNPRPIFIPDVRKEATLAKLRKVIVSEGIAALAFIPLVHRKKLVGKFMLYYESTHHFTKEEIRLAVGLTRYIAFVAKEEQTETELRRSKEELKAFIAKQKQIEEELRRSRDELDIILRNITDGITVQNNRGALVYANNAAAFASGYPSSSSMLKNPSTWFDRYDLRDENGQRFAPDRLPARRALEGEVDPEEVVNFHEKGNSHESRWSLVKARPVFDDLGNVKLAINITHDITAIKELEKRKEEFMGIVSHELKTPITSIKAFIQILQKRTQGKTNSELADYLHKAETQINSLTDLVGDLLDATRIQSGKLGFHKTLFNMRDLVDEVIDVLRHTSEKHVIKRKGDVVRLVFADRERIGQVLTNFLSNAIKYSPKKKKIFVIVSNDKTHVTVEVKDFGIGIGKQDQKRVFDRFFRADWSKHIGVTGLGVGLYISREIIRRHGGRIWVESVFGEGSSFYFSLPLQQRRKVQ